MNRPTSEVWQQLNLPRNIAGKRHRIVAAVRNFLLTRRPPVGSRVPAAHRLGQTLGVSYMTIHLALETLVREGWLVRHRGKGTFVARTRACKRRPQQSRLALVLPPLEDIRKSGFNDSVLNLLYGCNAGAFDREASLATVVLRSSFPKAAEIRQAAGSLAGSYDGCMFIGLQFSKLIEALHPRMPLVILGDRPDEYSHVTYNQREGIRLAVEHFRRHGYRRVGYLGQAEGRGRQKYQYFLQFVRQYRLATRDDWCWACPQPVDATPVVQRLLRQRTRPDAVFVDNYFKAETLVRLMEARRLRVPGDLAIIAYEMVPSATPYPWFSLVQIPHFEIGRQSVRLLDQLIRGERVSPSHRIVKPRLVIGRSCGCRGGNSISLRRSAA